MRAGTVVLLCMGLFSLFCAGGAKAAPAGAEFRLAQAVFPDAPPPRRRPRLRVYPQAEPDGVYPRYNPGPDAVRECNATYVQEFRPSGTVIVPHMSCHWRPGCGRLNAGAQRGSLSGVIMARWVTWTVALAIAAGLPRASAAHRATLPE